MTETLKIVIVGNGFGGIYTLKNLHKFFHNDQRIELTLVGEKNYFLFTPLLHEVATGGINPANIIEPIRSVLGCCLHKFYLGKAEIINSKNHTVKVGNDLVSYDYLVLAGGAETNFYDTAGAEKYCLTLKSIDDAVKIKNHCIAQMERASHTEDRNERKKILNFVVVGGGPTGVELVAELEELVRETFSHYYAKEVIEDVSITLIQRGTELVSQFGPKARAKSLETLKKKGIEVMLNTAVKEVGASYVIANENTKILTETVIWVAGIKPAEMKFEESVSMSPDGRLNVNEFLQLENQKENFAIGDMAFFKQENAPLPALAQVAEKESATVAKNIYNLINNKNPEKFVYKNSGNLMSLGQWKAVGQIANFTFTGHVAWFIWRTVYLSKLISFRKKVRVAVDWTLNLFFPRDISQL
ncbi:NAD(P)/FAD-dependent oxidoreductase [Candidatus Nomurabacteria bacterium]|nr:NAD(P)/FAD-dependent oxidoreductase [Candidatus Nomurabacteria bacterium]